MFWTKEQLWDYCYEQSLIAQDKYFKNNKQIEFVFAEFGVWQGYSINYFAKKNTNGKFYGFDSFLGLEEDWSGHILGKGTFGLDGVLPFVESNVTLINGWFENTIPDFKDNKFKFNLVHLDADTFKPTDYVLKNIEDFLSNGTILIFDEFLNYPGWKNHEYKAFNNFINSSTFTYKFIGFTNNQQVAVQLFNSNK